MRKQTKFVAVLSAAALLAMGASMTSFAAGWEKDEAGTWHYYDSSDDMVTNEWKKDGGKWFYLDDDGAMVTNQWVESDYYVGEDGAMVVNAWVKTLGDDEDLDSPEDTGEHWYYFGTKGKKVTGKKNIGGKTYYFDDDGKMYSGWQEFDNNIYYLGTEDEGWATKNQWRWLEKSGIDADEEDDITGKKLYCDENDDCDDEGWYWFDASGHMYNGNKLKTINGKKFMFNEHGQMLYEWINDTTKVNSSSYAQLDTNATAGSASIDQMLWFQENGDGASNGARLDGWQYIAGSESVGTDGDTNWYYFKKGVAKHAEASDYSDLTDGGKAVLRKKEKLSWNGKSGTFCFDHNGKMKTGLQFIGHKTYFFNSDGYMQTGKVANVEEQDESFNYYFNTKNSTKGQGYTGEKDGYLYFNGKRLEADDDYRIYAVNGDYYVVNNKGKLQKSFKKKDLELASGFVQEDVDLSFKKSGGKDYKLTATDFVKANAVLPHIQLEDTDNWIVGTVDGGTIVLNAADTALIDGLDILTYDAALAEGVDLQ